MTRVSLSAKHARALLAIREDHDNAMTTACADAFATLERALKPRPKSSQVRKTAAKRRAKRTETSAIYEEVAKRAPNTCECGCGRPFLASMLDAPTMDHFFGRARAESVDTVWRLRAECHRAKTDGWPDAGGWLVKFIEHCDFYGYESAREKAVARLEGMLSVRGGR
jgi:5-methylcytosine-specific restriction endonuclease McrA